MKTRLWLLTILALIPQMGLTETAESVAANELANAKRLLLALEARLEGARTISDADQRRLDALRANVAARGGAEIRAEARTSVEADAETTSQPRPMKPSFDSRLTVWSQTLQRQIPLKKDTRILVDGEIATVTEVLHPYQVIYRRAVGLEGLLTGRREYSSVYATIEIPGIESASVFKGDLVQSQKGAMVGTVEAVFDDGTVFIERFNGKIEQLGRVDDVSMQNFKFTRTHAASCRMSF